jgi:polysaccharide export outer membrane protein
MRMHLFLGLLLSLVLGGCASAGYGGLQAGSGAVQIQKDLPPPDPAELAAQQQSFHLGPLDTITVHVFGAEALETKGTIDSSGTFTMPLIGPVMASGLTTSQLSQTIADRLRGKYLKDPQVTIALDDVKSQTVTVDGAVQQPGIYPVLGSMSLIRAIATARGVTDVAELKQVAVFRTINGKPNAALFSIKDIWEGAYPDPQIYPNDIIVVGESATRRRIRDLSQILPAFGVFTPLARL